jgi:hypothetical protein
MNMSNHTLTKPRGGLSALMAALAAGLRWPVLLWWLIALAVPALIALLPIWTGLQSQFAYSPKSAAIAAMDDLPLMIEGLRGMSGQLQGISLAGMVATAISLLLSPWLTGMVVVSIRAGRSLGMGELAHAGLSEYGRMLRMLLWSIIPMGIAIAVGAAIFAALGKQAENAILASEAARASYIGMGVIAVLAFFAHATVEAGRGWMAADIGLRSVIRAWWRGLKLVLSRPLASLGVYLGTAIAGYGLALVFAWLRLKTGGPGTGGFVLGLIVTQLLVAMLAYARIARLHGFAILAADASVRREAAVVVPEARDEDEAGERREAAVVPEARDEPVVATEPVTS